MTNLIEDGLTGAALYDLYWHCVGGDNMSDEMTVKLNKLIDDALESYERYVYCEGFNNKKDVKSYTMEVNGLIAQFIEREKS